MLQWFMIGAGCCFFGALAFVGIMRGAGYHFVWVHEREAWPERDGTLKAVVAFTRGSRRVL